MNPKTNDKYVIIKQVAKKRTKYEVTYDELKENSSDKYDEKKKLFLEDQIVDFRILKGKEFSATDWEKVIREAGIGTWLNKAMGYISYKDRTIQEVKSYLKEAKLEITEVEYIIDKLKDLRFLDDERYAQKYLDECVRHQKGPLYIKNQMTTKGINRAIIDEVMINYSHEQAINDLVKNLEKALERLQSYPVNKQKETMMQKYLRDGFTSSDIQTAFNMVKWTADFQDRLVKDLVNIQKKTDDKSKIVQKLLQKGYSYSDIKNALE